MGHTVGVFGFLMSIFFYSTVDYNNFDDGHIEDQTGQYYDIEYCTLVKKNTDDGIRENFNPLETTADRLIMEIHGKPSVGDYSMTSYRPCARPFVTDGNLVITKGN